MTAVAPAASQDNDFDLEPDYDALDTGEPMLDLADFTPAELEDLFTISATEEVKNVHKTAPKGKPANRGSYADPKNYKWPIDNKHIRAAVSYFNHGNRSGYDSSMWATIGRRIASAANRLIGKGHSFSNGKIATAGSTESYPGGELPLGIVPSAMRVITEETLVNGVPCFRFEAMVIPGDAISKNTVPGKRGPTYYSARRIRAYAAQNQQLLEEMDRKGQKVTIYPRHAAALLDAALPMGWVDKYDVRPSATRPGLEDMWYTGLIPLTTEGRDTLMKLRTGLTKFSSLRTFPDDRFKTEPVRVDGRIVEEATSLPIAGIDLVATQPGLPVEPIRILEEAAHVEPATEEPMTAPTPPPHNGPQTPPQPAAQNQQQQQQGQPPAPTNGASQVPQQYATCPNCGADITHHIMAAHTMMNQQAQNNAAAGPQQAQGPQGSSGQQAQASPGGAPPMRTAREEQLDQRNAELEERVRALTAAMEGTNVSDNTNKPAVEGDGDARYAALMAKITSLETERDQFKSSLEEAMTFVKASQATQAVREKIAALVADDKTLGSAMRPIIERAVEEEKLTDVNVVELRYYKLRNTEVERRASLTVQQARMVPGFGHVSVEGLEEFGGRNASAVAGQNTTDSTDGTPAKKRYNPTVAKILGVMGDMSYAPSTHDAKE